MRKGYNFASFFLKFESSLLVKRVFFLVNAILCELNFMCTSSCVIMSWFLLHHCVFFVAQFCYLCTILLRVKFKFYKHMWWVWSLLNFNDFNFSCRSEPSVSPHYPSGFFNLDSIAYIPCACCMSCTSHHLWCNYNRKFGEFVNLIIVLQSESLTFDLSTTAVETASSQIKVASAGSL